MNKTNKNRAAIQAHEALLVFGFFCYFAIQIPYAKSDPDEGVYLAVAQRIADGQVPLRDFFTHQFPLLPWIQSLILRSGGNLMHARLFSLSSWTLAGIALILAIPRTRGNSSLRIAAICIWFASPLRIHFIQALGEPVSIFCLALSLLFFSRKMFFATGASFAVAVLVKPIVLIAFPALLLIATAIKPRVLHSVFLGGLVASCMIAGTIVLQAPKEFFAMIRTAIDFVGNSDRPPALFRILARHSDSNLFLTSIWTTFHTGHFWQLWAAPIGTMIATQEVMQLRVRFRQNVPQLLILRFAVLMLLFTIVLFRLAPIPVWSHYLLYYLVPLFLLSSAPISNNPALHALKMIAAFSSAAILLAGVGRSPQDVIYSQATAIRAVTAPNAKLLSFYPLLDQISLRKSACGMDDPIGTYNQIGIRQDSTAVEFHRFIVSDAQIIACLENDADTIVVENYFYFMLASPDLKQYIKEHIPTHRIVRVQSQ